MGSGSSKEPEERIELDNYIVFTKPTKYYASVKICGENETKLVAVKTQNKLDTLCGLLKSISSNIKWRVGSLGVGSNCTPPSNCKYSINCAKTNGADAISKSAELKLPFMCETNSRPVTPPNTLANNSTAPTNIPRNITATTQPRKSTASSFPTNTTRKPAHYYSTPAAFNTRLSAKSNYRSWKTAPSPYQINHLTIGFGVVAFAFFFIVIGLLIYVCKQRQKVKRRGREVVQASNPPPLTQIIVDREIHPSVEEAHNHQVSDHIKCSTNEEVDAPVEELYAQVDKRKKDIPSSSRLPQHTDNDDVIETTQAEQPLYAEIHKSKNPR